ncbi:MAG: DUF3226 domain-containing protein [Candidatus Njordarchaeales archaeon]
MRQLKPYEESFTVMARDLTKKFDCIILCEGKSDAEILKILNRRLNLQLGDNVAVTHAEGIKNLLELAKYISALARISRRLKLIGILIDLDNETPSNRFQRIKNSLNAVELDLVNVNILSSQLYNGLLKLDDRSLDIKIALAGLMDLPFQKHMIEDYVVKAAIINGTISKSLLSKHSDAKTLLSAQSISINEFLTKVGIDVLKKSFAHLITMLEETKRVI